MVAPSVRTSRRYPCAGSDGSRRSSTNSRCIGQCPSRRTTERGIGRRWSVSIGSSGAAYRAARRGGGAIGRITRRDSTLACESIRAPHGRHSMLVFRVTPIVRNARAAGLLVGTIFAAVVATTLAVILTIMGVKDNAVQDANDVHRALAIAAAHAQKIAEGRGYVLAHDNEAYRDYEA